MKLKIIAILAGLFLIGTLFMPGGSSVNVKNIYEEATKAFEEKKYQEAIDKYKLALEEGKKWGVNTKVIDEDFESNANFKIAACYTKLGDELDDPTMYEKSLEYIPGIYEKTRVSKVKEGIIFLWGHNLYQLERYEEAEPKFRELLNDYPDSQFAENAYYSLGKLYYELKQYESSREAFKMVIIKFPNSTFIDDAQYYIAKCFFDEANYDQAHLEFEKVQSTDETLSAQARYYNGLSLLRMGRNQDALTVYQKFIADFPNSVFVTAAYFDMGAIHGKLKEYDEATRNYELAIQHAKDELTKSEIQFQIGNNYFEQEDYQSAIPAYRKLIEGYPESAHIPEARFYIAESFWWLKDYENALAGYTEVLEKDPTGTRLAEATFKVGQCHYHLGDKELALEWYQKVLDNYPDSPVIKDATYEKIWALNELKRYEEAENVGRDYVNKYKTDPVYDIAASEIQMVLGDIKFESEDYIAAADEYLRVVSDYSDLPKFDQFKSKSLLQAGLAYYNEAERNNWDTALLSKAADVFSRLLDQYEVKFDKEKREFEARVEYIIPAIINLGLSYSKMKQFDKARESLGMMPKTSPEYGKAVFLKGETYSDEGRIDDAIAVYRGMVDDKSLSQTWRSRAAIEMATMLRDAGRHAEAAVEYGRIVENYPESEFVSTAQYLIGLSYFDIEPKTPENISRAIETYRKALDSYSNTEGALLSHLGIVAAYNATGAYDMVVKVAEEIENQYSGSDAPRAKEVIDSARRQKVEALEKLETGVSADVLIAELRKIVADPVGEEEGKASAQYRIGTLLFSEKRYNDAIKEYELLLEKFPGKYTAAAYYQISSAAYSVEDYQKSLASAQKGLLEVQEFKVQEFQDLRTGLNYVMGLAYNKVGNANDAIAAFKQAVQSGEGADKEQTRDTVFAARRELARAYATSKQHAEAVTEYKFLAENLEIDDEKADAYFWLARIYDEDMADYENASSSYDKVIELSPSDVLTAAQALYYGGVVYSKQLNDDERALSLFQELVSKYSAHEDSNVKLLVTDANLRIPELFVKLGKFDDAVARAKTVRDAALASGSKEDKINSQYQLGYLLGEQADKAGNPELSREAATEYGKVYEFAKPLSDVSDELKTLVAASLYNAGYLFYGLGTYEDYRKAVEYFDNFVRDFRKSENYPAALEYLGFTSFEMARLKADLDMFARAAEYFLRFAKEFPEHKDAPVAQFQAGEAYFAVAGGHSGNALEATDRDKKAVETSLAAEAYRKAIPAYRGVADKFRDSEYAPEALYTISASHMYIAESLADASAKQKEFDKMNAAYKELATKYPQNKYAAAAFLSVGNDYYNQASAENLSAKEKTSFYKLSLENYKKALQVPGIESRTRMSVEEYIRETEELLARDTYSAGAALVPLPGSDSEEAMKEAKTNAVKAIPYFKEVIDTLPNTDYADLSHVQLGLCYEYLEQWENAENSYGKLLQKYTDAKGNPIAPFAENVIQAVRFARDRKSAIMAYRISLKTQQQSGGQ